MRALWNEFKKFAMRGNVVDLAVAVVVGASFNKIVSSVVDDILMPVIGILVGRLDLTGLQLQVSEAVVRYGQFLQAVLDFLIIAFAVFMLVRFLNQARAALERQEKEEEASKAAATPPAPPKEQLLLEEIRDLLRDMRDRSSS